MDPLMIHAYKIHAIKKHKRQQFLGTIILYSLSALACTLLCSSSLWYPPFCATFNVVFYVFLPKVFAFFFTSKVLFIVGNLIVIFLVGESKFFTSKSKASCANYSDICYDKHKLKSPKRRVLSPPEAKFSSVSHYEEKRVQTECDDGMDTCCKRGVRTVEKLKHEDIERTHEEVNFPLEDLNKLADDFIARVNRQRRLEVEFCRS
ncbi:DUF4408 domain-containing protein [Tanacetum coccineum]